MFIKCLFLEININCLVDTGSTICILHPRKYNMIPSELRPEIKRNNTKLCLPDGSFINTLGYVYLPLQIGNFKVTHKFTIANIDVPAVIGYDFLHQYECTLELGKGVLIIGQNYIHCIKESQIESVFKVSITEKLTIPPNTEVRK